jgi:hypothetical protein
MSSPGLPPLLKRTRFGWITIEINNKIKYLKVPTYELKLGQGFAHRILICNPLIFLAIMVITSP